MDRPYRDWNDRWDRGWDRRPDPRDLRNDDREYNHERDDMRGRDWGWRGTELDRGFGPRRYDYEPRYDNRYDNGPRFDDRDRYPRSSPDPYRDDDVIAMRPAIRITSVDTNAIVATPVRTIAAAITGTITPGAGTAGSVSCFAAARMAARWHRAA